MRFAERAKQIKKEKNMTTEQISARSGIPVGTLSKIFSGAIAEPRLSMALSIAEALGVPLGCLLSREEHYTGTLDEEEDMLLRRYRRLDDRSRELVDAVMEKELERDGAGLSLPQVEGLSEEQYISLPLFSLPVSAGLGAWLDDGGECESVEVRATRVSLGADYALRVSGNSMEPKFEEGDILLVRRQNAVEIGDLGIFVADGEGYFKRYTGKYLHSFNPAYQDILIANFSEFRCCGKVIGQMKRRRAPAS